MDQLLTLEEAARLFRLRTGETFGRFARRHRIPLVKFGGRVVRVRAEDVDRAISDHVEQIQVSAAVSPGDCRRDGADHLDSMEEVNDE